MLGCVLHGLRRKLPVPFVSGVRIRASEQAGPESIRIMNLLVHPGNIADAKSVAFDERVEITQDVLAGTSIPVPLISIEECMTDERGPHDGGYALWQVKTP